MVVVVVVVVVMVKMVVQVMVVVLKVVVIPWIFHHEVVGVSDDAALFLDTCCVKALKKWSKVELKC